LSLYLHALFLYDPFHYYFDIYVNFYQVITSLQVAHLQVLSRSASLVSVTQILGESITMRLHNLVILFLVMLLCLWRAVRFVPDLC
jgi:hypothetical protein